MWTNGGDYASADGARTTLTDPAVVDALDFVAKLVHTHRVAPTPQTPLPPGSAIANQSVAMEAFAASNINAVRGQNKDLVFDCCLFPRGAGKYVSGGGGGGYVLSTASKHPDAAWELLKYIGAKEYAINKVRNGALGPRISTAREVFVQPGLPPARAAVYFDAPASARWEPNLTNWDDVKTEVDKALAPLWQGTQSAGEAAANAQRAFETLRPQGEIFQ
jgi:multiple sugar transport system substrate-binding protein